LRGSLELGQYTSKEFTDLLAEHQMVQSLSRPRQCWDNAVAESFFSSLKLELIDRRGWATRAQVRRCVVDYIEVFWLVSTPVAAHDARWPRRVASGETPAETLFG
jgi:transposase InsO family protein